MTRRTSEAVFLSIIQQIEEVDDETLPALLVQVGLEAGKRKKAGSDMFNLGKLEDLLRQSIKAGELTA